MLYFASCLREQFFPAYRPMRLIERRVRNTVEGLCTLLNILCACQCNGGATFVGRRSAAQ